MMFESIKQYLPHHYWIYYQVIYQSFLYLKGRLHDLHLIHFDYLYQRYTSNLIHGQFFSFFFPNKYYYIIYI